MMLDMRTYRSPSTGWLLRYGAPIYLLIFLLPLAIAEVLRDPGPRVGVLLYMAGLVIAFGIWYQHRLSKCCLKESPEGLESIRPIGSQTILWNDVEYFEYRRYGALKVVSAKLRNGTHVNIPAFVEGRIGRWQDGETTDMCGELNARLSVFSAA